MTAIVEVQNVSHRYGERLALDNLSLTVRAGEAFGLLGPNGSGKTTLLRLLSTLARPQSGTVRVAGIDVATQPADVRRLIGVVFQSPALDPHLTALENLLYHGQLYGLSGPTLRERARQLLADFDLADRANDRVRTLSGGLARRVELAKALLHRPRLLLLDEPSSGLDPAARAQLWQQLDTARRQHGVTLVVSTHLMDEADRCDRLAFLRTGQCIATNTPDALRALPGGDILRVRGTSAHDLETLATELRQADEGAPVISVTPEGATLVMPTKKGHLLVPLVISRLSNSQSSGSLHEVSLGRPTLDDVFMFLTGPDSIPAKAVPGFPER